ncbi:WD40 repeat-like protein [Auriculariales sp. MPI-PUGE-AT-0066]|nr:WD40 repeat-like protein [Auriculariales sp. MPI-PUGE-AT-0066]
MDVRSLAQSLSAIPSAARSRRARRDQIPSSVWKSLDRTSVLEGDHSHDGCVNALSWIDPNTLASSGDDCRVNFWRLQDSGSSYDFNCVSVIHTGHSANIFNVKLLPSSSSTLVTCARDGQVRVFDASRARGLDAATASSERGSRGIRDRGPLYLTPQEANAKVFRCHNSDVKRIVTMDAPDIFMSVSEDGTVRQFDLRRPHKCGGDGCDNSIIEMNFSLNALTTSPLCPQYLIVAGESPFGYLFDRRFLRGGTSTRGTALNTPLIVTECVARYGRNSRSQGERAGSEHITGARLSKENGEELLLSYHADAVYRYGLHDDPTRPNNDGAPREPRQKRRRVSVDMSDDESENENTDQGDNEDEEEEEVDVTMNVDAEEEASDGTNELIGESDDYVGPVVMPRTRYLGAGNIATVKDVNFIGQHDEYVVSGSDDGHWFMWNKSGSLEGVWEGDGSVGSYLCFPIALRSRALSSQCN